MNFKLDNKEILDYISLIPLIESKGYVYFAYGSELWGTQMWMVSRESAPKYLEKFTMDFMITNPTPFSPDWLFTKYGTRACIYPMLGVEEGNSLKKEYAQIAYHQQCHQVQYDPEKYI